MLFFVLEEINFHFEVEESKDGECVWVRGILGTGLLMYFFTRSYIWIYSTTFFFYRTWPIPIFNSTKYDRQYSLRRITLTSYAFVY